MLLPLIALTSLFVPVGSVRAGDVDLTKVLSGRDDVDFGRALAVAGYGELAEKLCFAIQRQNSGDATKVLECEALIGDIHFDQANRETDPNKRREKLEKVLDEKSNFVTSHGDTPIGVDVANSLPNLYRNVGDTLLSLLDATTDETQKGELRREAAKVFDEADSFIGKRVGKLRGDYEEAQKAAQEVPPAKDPNDPNPALDAAQAIVDKTGSDYLVAASGRAQTKYFHATTLAADDPQRAKLLNEVTAIYDDLELEFSNRLAIYDGFIFRGLAQDGLGRSDDALNSFDMAIRVRENFEKNEKTGVWQVPEGEVADVMSNAVHQKVLLLVKKGKADEAVKVANDFFATTLDGYKAARAVAILASLADAYDALDDRAGVEKTARKLIDINPNGPGKALGLKLLNSGGGSSKLGVRNLLALANQSAGSGEIDKAMELCRQVLALARGTPSEQDIGSEACVLLGALYGGKEQYEEAVVAWDTAMDLYPKGASAPDALWRSINGYMKLGTKQRRALWDKRYRERVTQLGANFPKHPNASRVTLLEGQRREEEGGFLEAAQMYERIVKGSPAYEEAAFRAGSAYAKLGKKLASDGKQDEAKKNYLKAEEVLRRAMVDVRESIKKSVEPEALPRLLGIDFSMRAALAGVLLTDSVNKPGEVIALLEDGEKLFPGDAEKLGSIWETRFRAYQALGKLDEATALLEAALKDKNTAAGLDRVALNAARVLDARAIELLQTKPDSPEVDAQLKKAFDWYLRGLAPQLEGRVQINAVQLEGIAQRMFIFGLHLNRVPNEVQSFIEWNGKVVAPETWVQAARIYTTILPYSSNPRTLFDLARVQAWLGKWKEASTNASKFFDRERYVDLGKKEIDRGQVDRKDMLPALLEWGVIEAEAAHGDSDTTHRDRANDILLTVGSSVNKDTKIWWESKFHHMELMYDLGEYAREDIALKSIERNSNNYDDGKYGFQEKFKKLRTDLDAKLTK